MRLFAAIPVPWDIAEALVRRQQGLPGARWRDPDGLHITLAFYGEVERRAAEDLEAELSRVSSPSFDLSLTGVGAFGDGHTTRAVWAGLAPSEALITLAGRCAAAARRARVAVEARDHRPHVTLAYLKPQTDAKRVAAWIAGHNLLASPPFRVDRFGLYSSVLASSGSHYTLERDYPL